MNTYGKKLQLTAGIICGIDVVLSALAGFTLMMTRAILFGVLISGIGLLMACVTYFVISSIGEITAA